MIWQWVDLQSRLHMVRECLFCVGGSYVASAGHELLPFEPRLNTLAVAKSRFLVLFFPGRLSYGLPVIAHHVYIYVRLVLSICFVSVPSEQQFLRRTPKFASFKTLHTPGLTIPPSCHISERHRTPPPRPQGYRCNPRQKRSSYRGGLRRDREELRSACALVIPHETALQSKATCARGSLRYRRVFWCYGNCGCLRY